MHSPKSKNVKTFTGMTKHGYTSTVTFRELPNGKFERKGKKGYIPCSKKCIMDYEQRQKTLHLFMKKHKDILKLKYRNDL
jgi:hypothetical protein